MTTVAIVENGPSLSPYFERALESAGVDHVRARVWRGAEFPTDFDACILTGDFHNITDGLRDYHRREIEFLEKLNGRKAFASCFAHQLIALAHGGRVSHRDRRLLRWEHVNLQGTHPLTRGMTGFDAVCLNVDEVADAPSGAALLGASEHCACQVLAYGTGIVTCQAHPEMSVRRGQFLVNALAIMLAGGPNAAYGDYRSSRPAAVPRQSEFMSEVIGWLISG